MPRAKKAPVQPVAPIPPPTPPAPTAVNPNPDNLPVIYPKLEINEYSTITRRGRSNYGLVRGRTSVGETEKEYQQRMVKENPASKLEHWLLGGNGPALKDGRGFQPVHCRDAYGQKVVCWNNAHNRPFDETWCEELIHTILYGQWAGPFTIPGVTSNGGNHAASRGIRARAVRPAPDDGLQAGKPVAAEGAGGQGQPPGPPEVPGVGQARSPIHRNRGDKGVLGRPARADNRGLRQAAHRGRKTCSTPPARSETCTTRSGRSCAGCWRRRWTCCQPRRRTGVQDPPGNRRILERHKRLLKCVEHIYARNKPLATGGRKISGMRLVLGDRTALPHGLLGQQRLEETNPNYGYEYRERPSQHRARSCWTGASGTRPGTLESAGPVAEVIPGCNWPWRRWNSNVGSPDNKGLGGRGPEKMAILAKAWEVYMDHPAAAGSPFSRTTTSLCRTGRCPELRRPRTTGARNRTAR